MGNITFIKECINGASSTAYIRNLETPSDTGGPGKWKKISPGGNWTHDIWVPWATSAEAFRDKHLEIKVEGEENTLYIWQANMADGDSVRLSWDGWHSEGNIYEPGTLGGEHTLVIGDGPGAAFWPWPIVRLPDGTVPKN